MTKSVIPGFDPVKGREFVETFSDPVVRDFVHLLILRDIDAVPITGKRFLKQQESIIPHLANIFGAQNENGGWLSIEKDLLMPLYRSTHWILIYLGYLGLNGTKIPEVVRAVDYAHENLRDSDGLYSNTSRHYGGFLECNSATFLWSLLKMGFGKSKQVREDCMAHLTRIHDREGLCKYKKGGTPCAFVNIKDLILLNEFPEKWRDDVYRESVKNIQKYLLSYDLSTADYPRQNPNPNKHWMNFAHFRSYQSSVFQGAEALVMSGIRNHKTLKEALKVVGSKCIDERTWKTNYIQRKFPLQLEKGLSPWLTVSGLRIIKAFSA